ncbi:related to endoglucanase IV precursor [Cephalotrichum gorgonifer]|uniref:lytic cellulose monooxygenase (C4-dehydrogenating) n=1 Tax=Cephalotrichum gorgonifer TaxID=2041049 RepID=A0AAE8SZ03_9PEZI|nr:related to endoglucanase IV precursor [Cephalotrichum gorgonifer]
MSFASKLALLSGLAATALAHGTVTGFTTDGKYNGGFLLDYYYMEQNGQTPPATAGWYAENLDNGFVEPNAFGTADIICHKNSKAATSSATVAAGGTVEFQWTNWPESHVGPVLTYIADCGSDCGAVNKESLKWVKIDEAGFDTTTKEWAAIAMIANNNTWATTVPETIAPGNYVFRHEIIALHAAGQANGAQNYPQCVNIRITGSGTDRPEGVVGTKLYTADEPGIIFNPYAASIDYPIPGPALYGSGGSTPQKPTETSAPVPSPTNASPSETAAPSPTVAPTPSSTPTPPANGGGKPTLPETFTLETFISWLTETAGSKKARRSHAKDIRM